MPIKKAEIEEISYKLGQITSNIENLDEKFDRIKKCLETLTTKYDDKIDIIEKNNIKFDERIKHIEEIKVDERLDKLENSHFQIAKEIMKNPKTIVIILGGVIVEVLTGLKTVGVI